MVCKLYINKIVGGEEEEKEEKKGQILKLQRKVF